MRAFLVTAMILLPLTLAGCYSRTVEERTVPAPAPSNTVVVPPGSTVICPAGQSC